MNRNILRQITDIKIQAEKIISGKTNLGEIEEFSKYSKEIKSFLIANVEDEFILKYIHEIPQLNIDDLDEKNSILSTVFSYISFGASSIYKQNKRLEQAIEYVIEIRGKYASIEFMLKDYLGE